MKKRLLLVALLGVAGVLAVRTARFVPAVVTVPPVKRAEVDAAKVAAHLAQALTFATVSNQDRSKTDPATFAALHHFLEATYPATYRTLVHEDVAPASLIFTWKGSDASLPPLLLLAHQDVVPVEPGTEAKWTQPPFAGHIADGFVWGRGAIDDKGSLIGILEAVEALVNQGFTPHRTVILGFGADEEIGGGQGMARVAEVLHQRGVHPLMVLDEGQAVTHELVTGVAGDVALIGIAEKGYASVELSVHAEGGHSSMPPPQTAVGILSHAVWQVEQHPMPARLAGVIRAQLDAMGREMPLGNRVALSNLWLLAPVVTWQMEHKPQTNAMIRTTTAPTMLEGSVKENVLPATARAVINFRILPGDTIAGVLEHVQHAVDDPRVQLRVMEDVKSEPSPESPTEGAPYAALQKTIREMFPGAKLAPSLVLGATDSRHTQILGAPIYRFAPWRLGPTDLPRIHGTDERVSVDDVGGAVAFYERLIQNVDAP